MCAMFPRCGGGGVLQGVSQIEEYFLLHLHTEGVCHTYLTPVSGAQQPPTAEGSPLSWRLVDRTYIAPQEISCKIPKLISLRDTLSPALTFTLLVLGLWCVGVWVELGQLSWYGWSWASCCGMGGAGPAVVVWVELGQLSWYGWSWASCRGMGGAGPAVVVWVELGQLSWYGWSWACCVGCCVGEAEPAVMVWVELGLLCRVLCG